MASPATAKDRHRQEKASQRPGRHQQRMEARPVHPACQNRSTPYPMTSPISPSAPSKYDQVVQAIVKAVPEILAPCHIHAKMKEDKYRKNLSACLLCAKKIPRPITLEDVLRAHKIRFPADGTMRTNESFRRHHTGQFSEDIWDFYSQWHLGKPLSEQPPETIAFLHSLLCQ